ncbi:MAG: hypothetical protein AMXMBFR56_65680 [Polyangiaceae bacterium]
MAIAPRIHLNGSHGPELFSKLRVALDALLAAEKAVAETAPNARDYYTISDAAFGIAAREHANRMASLRELREELLDVTDDVLEQLEARREVI